MEQKKRRKPLCEAPGYIAVSREAVPVDDLLVPPTEARYIIFEATPDEIVALEDSSLSSHLKKETGNFYDVSELEDCEIEGENIPILKRIAERLLSESGDEVERSALTKVIKASEEAERVGTGAPIVFWF